MSLAYRFGCIAIRAVLYFPPLATGLSTFSRVWSRHSRIYRHLKAANYDAVIDGGANIGEFAGIVRAALPDADLVCVEPHPDCAASLRAAGYRVIEAALWHSQGTAMLEQPGKGTTSCKIMQSGNPLHSVCEVGTIRLDAIPITGSRILVKLDLQGSEIDALAGMDSIWDRTEAVLSEVSLGRKGTYEPIREILKQRNFREASTINELEMEGTVVEADKLWLRAEAHSPNVYLP